MRVFWSLQQKCCYDDGRVVALDIHIWNHSTQHVPTQECSSGCAMTLENNCMAIQSVP